MNMTPMDIREHSFSRKLKGYNITEVAHFKEAVAAEMETSIRHANKMKKEIHALKEKLSMHEHNETILRETLTTAQKFSGETKKNAKKEADLIILEARNRGKDMVREAQSRVADLHKEIYNLKKQRLGLQAALKSVIDHYANLLSREEEESTKGDMEDDKFRFMQK